MTQKAWASPEVVSQILLVGKAEEPNEACGVITPDSTVVRLPNTSPSPQTSYVVASEDLINAIDEYLERTGREAETLQREQFIIWHTHPGGVVGPGPGDMRERLPGFQYLVVTLPTGEAVQF